MTPEETFARQVRDNVARLGADEQLRALSLEWMLRANAGGYTYNYRWLGRPIIQYPQDIVVLQEIIWAVKPDLVIETGIAHGGSLVLSASVLAMLDYADAVARGIPLDPARPSRSVLGIDIEIRPHNRAAIEAHPMASRIETIEGSSIAPEIVAQVRARAQRAKSVLVCLDSNHTHDHVLAELEAYAPLVSRGSYCIVLDTLIEDVPAGSFPTRGWDKGNNPKTAVREFLRGHREFEVDRELEQKLLISVAPEGFLKRV